MIGQIIGSLGGLATTYLDSKAVVKKAEAENKDEGSLLARSAGSRLRYRQVMAHGKMRLGRLLL